MRLRGIPGLARRAAAGTVPRARLTPCAPPAWQRLSPAERPFDAGRRPTRIRTACHGNGKLDEGAIGPRHQLHCLLECYRLDCAAFELPLRMRRVPHGP